MTAADMYAQIDALVEAAFAHTESLTTAEYAALRQKVLEATKSLWTVASIDPYLDETIGNMMYVDKAAAFKYGRFDKYSAYVKDEVRKQAILDMRNTEALGIDVYTTEYNGAAWVYQQGYGLPVTGGVKLPLVAKAVYSDFYGKTFAKTIKANLGKYAQTIIDATMRGLNQGHAYSKIAEVITEETNKAYNRAIVVARTEGGRIQSMAYLDSLGLLDATGTPYQKRWSSAIDNRTRESHIEMDGKYADKHGIFELPSGATGPAPRMTGSASEDIQCRCSAETIIDGVAPTERRIRGEGIVPYETFKQRLARGGAVPVTEIRRIAV
jgi:hypothetical protein